LKAPLKEADEQLLVEAAKRDSRQFAALYERNFHRVYAYVSRRVQKHEEAEDITSEVFHHALANLGNYQWRDVPFVAWLYKIAANAITDRWKRAARENSRPLSEKAEPREMQQIEIRALLFELVNELPADQKRVVVQRFVEQKTIREIAQELKRSEGAVKQLQFRALTSLRSRMEGARG
jgi:RNA polymerase sigma-70 factor (ECF subfamily)